MRSEREKMLAGELYNAPDPELVTARNRARDVPEATFAAGNPCRAIRSIA
jgi:maltose O-acetyltransferase